MGATERHIANHFGVEERTARQMLLAADRRQFTLISALTFVLVVLAVAVLTTSLAALLLSVYLGAAGLVIAVPLALVIAPLLALHMEAHSRATAAIRVIENARLRHECLHCGYDLRPNLGDTGVPTCPECGEAALHLPAPGPAIPPARHR